MMEQAGAPVNSRHSGRSRSQEPRRVWSPGSLGVPRPRYSRRLCAPGSPSAPPSVPQRDAGSKSGTAPYPACAARRAPARAYDNITVGANPERCPGPYGSRGSPPRCCCVPATSGQHDPGTCAHRAGERCPRGSGCGQASVTGFLAACGLQRSTQSWHTRRHPYG